MKEKSKELLYDKRVAGGMSKFFETISEVHSEFDHVSWTSQREVEYGFYGRNKAKKTELFFGIWYSAWEFFEVPLCLAVGYTGSAPYEKHQQIKAHIEKKNITGLVFKDFEEFAVILFEHSFFNLEDDSKRIANIFEDMSNFLLSN